MKILIISDYGTLSGLHDQAIKLMFDGKLAVIDLNAFLHSKSHKNSWASIECPEEIQLCFGFYYNEIPITDSRFEGKGDLVDFVVEIGSNMFAFIKPESYIHYDSIVSLDKIMKGVKNNGKTATKSTTKESEEGTQEGGSASDSQIRES